MKVKRWVGNMTFKKTHFRAWNTVISTRTGSVLTRELGRLYLLGDHLKPVLKAVG